MAILGNNIEGGGGFSAATGRKVSTKVTVARPYTLQELHAFVYPSSGNTWVIHVYADSSGSPGARVAYTGPITLPLTAAVVEISQSGFNIPMAAGDYWFGISYTGDSGDARQNNVTGTLKSILGGAAVSPPSDPYGTTNYSGTGTMSVWAVAEPIPVPAIRGSLAGRGGQALPTYAQMIGRSDAPYLANRSSQRAGVPTGKMDHALQLATRAWPDSQTDEAEEARPLVGQIWPRSGEL